MREEIQRISKLVAEGRLSPEDAADLIDAFYASERTEEPVQEPAAAAAGAATGGAASNGTPPPPPPPPPGAGHRDPLKNLVESIEKITKEKIGGVDWQEVSKHARTSAKKGLEALQGGLEDLSKGKVNLGFFLTNESREVTLPLVVAEGKTLRVENACGNIKIHGGQNSGRVTARAKFRGASADDARAKAEAYTLIVEESDHSVVIRQPDVSGLHADLDITLVGGANIEVRSESGDIEVIDTKAGCRVWSKSGDLTLHGIDGAIEIQGESGDVHIDGATAPSLSVENKSGNIEISKVRANVNVRTATGEVSFNEVSGRTVAVESVSGHISLDLVDPVTGSVNIRTVNGDVVVGVADGSDARVSLSTLRGVVECKLELTDVAKQDQRITGRLGAGTGTLDVSAVTGDVRVELRNAASA